MRRKHNRWTRLILAVLCPCLLLFAGINVYILHRLEQSVQDTNTYLNALIQSAADRRLEETYRYTFSLEVNNANSYLKGLSRLPDTIPAAVYKMHDVINDYVTTNAVVKGMYLYYPSCGFTVGDLGCFPAASYRRLQTIPQNHSPDAWIGRLVSSDEGHFFLDGRGEQQTLCYISPRIIRGENRAVKVLEIDPAALLEEFSFAQELFPTPSSLCVLLDGTVLTLEGNAADQPVVEEMFQEWRSNPTDGLYRNGVSAFFSESILPGLYYASFYEENIAAKAVQTTIWVCVGSALLSLLIAAAGSIYIGYRSMEPLQRVLQKLGASNASGDSYEILDERVETLMAEHSEDRQKLSQHQALLASVFLNAVLRGELRTESTIFAAANRYGVAFEDASFQVLLLANKRQTPPSQNKWSRLLCQLMEQEHFSGIYTVFHERICILLNLENPIPVERMDIFCAKILDTLYPNEAAAGGVGECYDSMASISSSYQCAYRALLSGELSIEHPIYIYRSELMQRQNGSSQVMQLFSRQIYQRQFSQALKTVDQLCNEYLDCGRTPAADLLHRQAVSNLLFDAANESLSESEADHVIEQFSEHISAGEYRGLLKNTLTLLDRTQFNLPPGETKQPLAQRAKTVIEENYADPMMGLYLVSERLNVSNSYLSSVFKATYQISVLQYINKLRIERAKELLRETSMTIKDIALLVGFSSDVSFIRVFKKAENKTPSVFRSDTSL